MGRMSERWGELQDDLELADCEFQHWQEQQAADPAYLEWAAQLEHEQETEL